MFLWKMLEKVQNHSKSCYVTIEYSFPNEKYRRKSDQNLQKFCTWLFCQMRVLRKKMRFQLSFFGTIVYIQPTNTLAMQDD